MHRFLTLRFEAEGTGGSPAPTGTSESVPGDPAGSSSATDAEGAGGGSADASVLADGGSTSGGTNFEEVARRHQSRADRAEMEARQLRQQLESLQGNGTQNGGSTDQPLSESRLQAILDSRAEMERTYAEITQRFPNAHPEIFRRYNEYGDPDSLYLAAEQSHRDETAYRERIRREEAERLRAGGAAPGQGNDPRPPATAPNTATHGDPTVAELNRMSHAELDALEKEKPGTLNRVLMGAEQDVMFTAS